MYRGQLFYEPPDNIGVTVVLLVSAEAAFSKVITRVPSVRLEAITVGEDCSVVVGEDGELFFALVNESPFGGDFTAVLTCADPAYTVRGTNSIGVGVPAGPSRVTKSFLISVNRQGLVPNPNGGDCSITLFDPQGAQIPGALLTVGCREEQKAFAGPVGEAGTLDECGGDILCEWSNLIKAIIVWIAIVILVLLIIVVARKFIRRS